MDFDKLRACFESHCTPEPNTGCCLWFGATDKKGYGKMTIDRKTKMATHVAWFLKHGTWPDKSALHRCDTPACVSDDHLFLGTQADNMRDMHCKGRAAVGERMPVSKLTDAQVRGIRFLSSLGRKGNVLAAQYGVSKMTISRIINRKLWAHVDG